MKPFVKAVGGLRRSVIYTDGDGRHYRFYDGTWAWRNHNPGNLRPGVYANRHDPIGVANNFAIFPTDEFGRAALIDLLQSKYGNCSIHEMIYQFSPPSENPTKKDEAYLHKVTGIMNDKKIKDFTPTQFKAVYEAIEHFEKYMIGKIVEVYPISGVQIIGKNRYQYCLDEGEWISESECIQLAEKRKVELEICISKLDNQFLRTPPNSVFQKRLEDIICKK